MVRPTLSIALYGALGRNKVRHGWQTRFHIHNSRQAVTRWLCVHFRAISERDGTFQERNLSENVAAVKELVKHETITDAACHFG